MCVWMGSQLRGSKTKCQTPCLNKSLKIVLQSPIHFTLYRDFCVSKSKLICYSIIFIIT